MRRTAVMPWRTTAATLVLAAIAAPAFGDRMSSVLPPPSSPSASSLSPQERNPLYREFLEWRANRAKAGNPSR